MSSPPPSEQPEEASGQPPNSTDTSGQPDPSATSGEPTSTTASEEPESGTSTGGETPSTAPGVPPSPPARRAAPGAGYASDSTGEAHTGTGGSVAGWGMPMSPPDPGPGDERAGPPGAYDTEWHTAGPGAVPGSGPAATGGAGPNRGVPPGSAAGPERGAPPAAGMTPPAGAETAPWASGAAGGPSGPPVGPATGASVGHSFASASDQPSGQRRDQPPGGPPAPPEGVAGPLPAHPPAQPTGQPVGPSGLAGPSAGQPPGPYPGPARLDLPPELPAEPGQGRKMLLRGGAIVLALIVLGGAAYVGLRAFGGSPDEPEAGPPSAVVNPAPYRTPQGPRATGGPTAQRVHAVLREAGFACGRIDGQGRAKLGCHRAQVRPTPVQHEVIMTLVGTQTANIEVAVKTDPAWHNVTMGAADDAGGGDGGNRSSGDKDSGSGTTFGDSPAPADKAAPETFRLVTNAAVPQADRVRVNRAIAAAREKSRVSVDTTAYSVAVSAEATGQRLTLRAADAAKSEDADGADGLALAHVPLSDLEKVATQAELSCERGRQATMCEGNRLTVRIGYADEKSIGEVRVHGPSTDGEPADRLVDLATAVAEVVADRADDPALARGWVQERCFADATHRLLVGGAYVACSPSVSGSAADYSVSGYRFRLAGAR